MSKLNINTAEENRARSMRVFIPNVGDEVAEKFQLGESREKKLARVVYVHPQRWFYMAEFEGKCGVKIRQCFSPFGRGTEE